MPRNPNYQVAKKINIGSGAKNTANYWLYPAEQWKGGSKGSYRVQSRVGKKANWVGNDDGSMRFFTMGKVLELVALELGYDDEAKEKEATIPDLPVDARVRVLLDGYSDYPKYERTTIRTAPERHEDGRWFVGVKLFHQPGITMIPADYVEPIN